MILLCLGLIISFTACNQPANENNQQGSSDPPSVPKIGFANLHERNDFAKQVRNSMEREALARGWELICVDNNADGATAIRNAADLITMGIDYMIEFNIDAAVAPAVMELFNEAGIPVIAIDVIHPGAIFFGANNARAGQIAGEAAADYVNSVWGGEFDFLVLITQMAAGEVAATRVGNVRVGMQNKGLDVPDSKVVEIEGQNDAQVAQARIADFLMANPNATRIVIGTNNDVTAAGAHAAAVTAGREWDVAIFSQNATAIFVEPMYEYQGDWSFRGSVGYFPHRYGEWVFPILDKMVAGEATQDNYYIDHVFIDWSNIAQFYPEDNLPWN